MDAELFFIDPSTHLELARKVAFRMNKFQSWDEVEVIGRKVELLGQSIEEVYRKGFLSVYQNLSLRSKLGNGWSCSKR